MRTRSMNMGQSLTVFALVGALQATGLFASDPWSWANVTFNSVPTNTQPPTSSPVAGTVSTNLSQINGMTNGVTLLVQSKLGDATYGLNDKPVVFTHTNSANSAFNVLLSSSLGAGTLPTSGLVHVSWDYVATQMAFWGPGMSLRRGDPSYQALFYAQERNNGPDLGVTTASGVLVFTNVLTLGQATHFDVMLNLDSSNMVFSFSNPQTNVSFSSGFANIPGNANQAGYFVVDSSPSYTFVAGLDNLTVIPEPQTIGLGLAALGGLLGYARFRGRAMLTIR